MAAMDFPSSPTNGQVANGYTYDSAKGAWRKNAAITVSVTTSAVAPSNPNPGDQWLYTNEGTLFTWWSDGTSSQWVQSSSVIANADPNPMPAGSIMAWGGATAPQNWLLCDGSAVSRSTYASLFAAIGIQYGTGDGSTTFNLPNLKGRTIVGLDSTQTEFDALGETGGAKTHTLTSAEIPSHTHSFSATTSTTGSHNHISNWASITGYNYVGSGGNSTWPFGGGSNAAQRDLQAAGDHAHTVSGTTGTAGTGGAHNNLQPYIVLNYIIKASAGVTPGDSVLTTRVGVVETRSNSTPLSENVIINGNMDIWQRGTSFSVPSSNLLYTADRWYCVADGTTTVSQVSTGQLVGSKYSLRAARATATPGSMGMNQLIETENVRVLHGKTVTFSVYIRRSSGIAYPLSLGVYKSATVDAANSATWTSLGSTSIAISSIPTGTTSTDWYRASISVAIPSDGTANTLLLTLGTYNVANTDYFEMSQAQLEVGSFATPFRRNAPSIQGELAACQRYYWRVNPNAPTDTFTPTVTGISGTSGSCGMQFPVAMRASVTVGFSALYANNYVSTNATVTSVSAGGGRDGTRVSFSGTGWGAGTSYIIQGSGSTSYLDFSAEL